MRKLQLTPRKVPRQRRAHATVDAILIATCRLLVKEGYEGLTTNQVAVVAGVSIGSLYQYFPSIDSIVSTLYQNMKAEAADATSAALVESVEGSVEEIADAVVGAMLDVYRSDAAVYALLVQLAPRIGAARKTKEIDDGVVADLEQFLTLRADDLRVSSPGLTARMLFSALDGAVLSCVAAGSEVLDAAHVETELTTLVRGMLAR